MHTRRYQRGWTLLELIIVASIIAVVMAILVYTLAGTVNRNQKYQRVVADVGRLVDAAHTWRHSHDDYNTITIPELQDLGILPPTWGVLNGNKIQRGKFTYSIAPYNSIAPYSGTTQTYNGKECPRNEDRCFVITVEGLNSPCTYIIHLAATHPIYSNPIYWYSRPGSSCIRPGRGDQNRFSVMYD